MLEPRLSAFAQDVSKFIVNFNIPISHSVPHIYLSALPFSPSNSLIFQHYRSRIPNTLSIVLGGDQNWPAMVAICRGHTGRVNSVALSCDGKWIASGSDDQTICVSDSETGQVSAGPFKGYTSGVTSVGFSPNGRKVVSGSSDKAICVWDVKTGQVSAGPFKGHTSGVTSVGFSPDGRKVVI